MNQNQTLTLRDIHLPADPEFWPPAPGWWLLATLLLLFLGWAYLKISAYRRQKRKIKQQHEAIFDALKPIENKLLNKKDNENINKDIANLNVLLRQLALMQYPQSEIASLSGKQWLAFLDKSGATQKFSTGAGRILADTPYLAEARQISKKEAKELISIVKSWIHKAEIIE